MQWPLHPKLPDTKCALEVEKKKKLEKNIKISASFLLKVIMIYDTSHTIETTQTSFRNALRQKIKFITFT